MLAAYTRKYPELELQVKLNPQTGEVEVESKKEVVTHVEDAELEIGLRKAHTINKKSNIGDFIWVPFDGGIGRIEILRAKQVIASKIRSMESSAIYNDFINKKGSIIHGTVHKCEFGGVSVKLQDDVLAFMPKSLMLPTDQCVPGMPIRAILKDVYLEPRNENQLILDRSAPEFVKSLLELEVPEVFEKIVEVKKIVRAPGYKTKIVVISNDANIDPVGTCVGVGGARIKPILKEISGEKIDIISQKDSEEEMVKFALKPAEISRVEIIDEDNVDVWLEEDQRSLAIGKQGKNISLATQLVGRKINLVESAKGSSGLDDVDFRDDQE